MDISTTKNYWQSIFKDIVESEAESMNEWQRMFFKEQCANAKRHPNARRYHPDVIRWAIELYARAPSAYHMLRTTGVLTLPSSGTLRHYRCTWTLKRSLNLLIYMVFGLGTWHHQSLAYAKLHSSN